MLFFGSVSTRTRASSSSGSKHRHNGQTADQLRDEAELDEVVRLDLLQQLLARLILVQRCAQLAAKAEGGVVGALLNELFQPVERAAADEQDILRVDLDELLLRVLASAVAAARC